MPPARTKATAAGACKGTVSDRSPSHPILPPTDRIRLIHNRRHPHDHHHATKIAKDQIAYLRRTAEHKRLARTTPNQGTKTRTHEFLNRITPLRPAASATRVEQYTAT